MVYLLLLTIFGMSLKSIQQFVISTRDLHVRLEPYRILNDDSSSSSSSSSSDSSSSTASISFQNNNSSNNNNNIIIDALDVSTTKSSSNDYNGITIDMISVGSITRQEYQIQQERTFGSHPSIRHFYRFNEHNDTSDPQCSTQLSSQQLQGITQFCNQQWDADDSTIRTWLRKRLKPFRYAKQSLGWLCAQKRPIDALQFLLGGGGAPSYRDHPERIPDYVVLIDDDTYMNMDTFVQGLQNYTLQQLQQQQQSQSNITSSDHIHALLSGCVFNFPRGLQFHFPHGGYGSILSKATILNLIRPIHCHNNNNKEDDSIPQNYTHLDPFTRMACWRLYEQNHFNELQYFVDGMSVLDLMYNYTKRLSFLNVNQWENGDGFCFHSDHALGYFLGFYHVAIPDHVLLHAELSDNVRQQYPYGYSEITVTAISNEDDDDDENKAAAMTTRTPTSDTINSQCTNSYYEQCSRNDMVCHYIQPKQMERMYVDNVYYEDEVKMKLQLLQSKQQNESLTFDVISIGSQLKPQLQVAQKRTFGSHPSIRHWYRINERNDTDTTCSTKLTMDHVAMIYNKCKTTYNTNSDDDDETTTTISEESELIRRRLFFPKNHTGWMCAQKRPIDGLYKALQKYKTVGQQKHSKQAALSLPSYLVIIDDDTYMNMNYLMEALPQQYPSYESYIITGCRLTHPKRIQFTFPFGGFGTILSRRAIENLMRPIYCNNNNHSKKNTFAQQTLSDTTQHDLFNTMACWRLEQNLFGEQIFFKDGMSVLDLLYAFSSGLPFTKVQEWKNGIDFCFHSDHALGYFFGFYHIAVTDEKWTSMALEMKNDPKKQLDAYRNDRLRESFTYTGLKRDEISGCKYRGNNKCTNDAPFCHYIEADHMETLYNIQMAIQ